MLLSDGEIKEVMRSGELKIEDFSENLLQPASYDLRVGRRGLKSVKEERSPVIDLEREGILQIGTAEFVELLVYEKLELGPNIAGHMGLRSYFTRKGLILFSGPQIDPGFHGYLNVSLFNTGPRPIVLKFRDPFCTVEFVRLGRSAEAPYSGPYQNQNDFPSDNIEFIIGAKGVTLYEVVEIMKNLRYDVKWLKWLLLAILAALIAALVSKVV